MQSNWAAENGDRLAGSPLTATKLLVEPRDQVVDGDRLRSLDDPSFALGGLYMIE